MKKQAFETTKIARVDLTQQRFVFFFWFRFVNCGRAEASAVGLALANHQTSLNIDSRPMLCVLLAAFMCPTCSPWLGLDRRAGNTAECTATCRKLPLRTGFCVLQIEAGWTGVVASDWTGTGSPVNP